MIKNLTKFGTNLKGLRLKSNFSLREICRKVNYDPSNWSKIERGKISPPSDENTLCSWAIVLGLKKDSAAFNEFIDSAMIAQGIIPADMLDQQSVVNCLPAFFRTLRNKKPTKEEIDHLVDLIKNI